MAWDIEVTGTPPAGFMNATMILKDEIVQTAAKKSVGKMRAVAKTKVHVQSGQLRQSIMSNKAKFVDEKGNLIEYGIKLEYQVTTNVDYAVCEEYGVGIQGDPGVPHVPKSTWTYYDKEAKQFKTAKTRPGHSYLRYALDFQRPNYKKYLQEAIEETNKKLTGRSNP